eukprot:scaffold90432_cov63-Phaeocystis_antarctica.AAC.2
MHGSRLDEHVIQLKLSARPAAAADAGAGAGGAKRAREPTAGKAAGGGGTASAKLAVRNVPFEANKKELKELFAAFGQLKTVRLPAPARKSTPDAMAPAPALTLTPALALTLTLTPALSLRLSCASASTCAGAPSEEVRRQPPRLRLRRVRQQAGGHQGPQRAAVDPPLRPAHRGELCRAGAQRGGDAQEDAEGAERRHHLRRCDLAGGALARGRGREGGRGGGPGLRDLSRASVRDVRENDR